MKKSKAVYIYRSAITGRLVTEYWALRHPHTTTKDLVKKIPKKAR